MSLFDSLTGLKSLLVDGDGDGKAISADNWVLKLHSKWTVTLLLAFSVLLSLSQYAGDPIDCMVKHPTQGDTFDQYCWVEGTWTRKTKPAFGEVSPGASSHLGGVRCFDDDGGARDGDGDGCWHHQYYQWVALVLVLQAGCFYFPKYLWHVFEEGRVSSLVSGLDRATLIRGLQSEAALTDEKGELRTKIRGLVAHWREEARGNNRAWAAKFYLCEVLCALNATLQFYLTDWFLGGHFNRVALDGLNVEEHDSVLPVLAECRLKLFGKGGDIERVYGLCVLPLNIVNQKFYTIFWIWLSVLQVVTIAWLVFRVCLAALPEARKLAVKYRYGVKDFDKSVVVTRCGHSDWLLLSMLLGNMNPVIGAGFLTELASAKEYVMQQEEEDGKHK